MHMFSCISVCILKKINVVSVKEIKTNIYVNKSLNRDCQYANADMTKKEEDSRMK